MSINFMGATPKAIKNTTSAYFKPDTVTNTTIKEVKKAIEKEADLLNDAIKAKYMPHPMTKSNPLKEAEESYLISHGK